MSKHFLSLFYLCFSLGNILLKIRRAKLPRPEFATSFTVFIALVAVLVALHGTIEANPEYLITFLDYFFPSILIVFAMLARKDIMLFLANVLRTFPIKYRKQLIKSERSLYNSIKDLTKQQFIFFSKGDDISTLNKVMMYLHENEETNHIKIISILENYERPSEQFLADFDALDRAYPAIDMEYIIEEGRFTPEKVEELSQRYNIPKNFMFLSSPGERFSHRVEDLGGVRLIL